jgi:hypothetical protein
VRTRTPSVSKLRNAARQEPRVRDASALVLCIAEPRYRVVLELTERAAAEGGMDGHVVTDDAPAARPTRAL